MPPFPPPRTRVQVTERGKLSDVGFVETTASSECWACGKESNKRSPGVNRDLWRCECGTEWATPVRPS